MARSRGAATYAPSTPRASHRAPPCIWTFLSSLGKREFFSIPLGTPGQEGATTYRITWSALMRTDWGMVRPSALAVFMLMTNSKRVGCSTGRSAGLAPLRILST